MVYEENQEMEKERITSDYGPKSSIQPIIFVPVSTIFNHRI
jgi:hypothetical protein